MCGSLTGWNGNVIIFMYGRRYYTDLSRMKLVNCTGSKPTMDGVKLLNCISVLLVDLRI